jgi:lipopolysaccharide transport system ATP-binding protein
MSSDPIIAASDLGKVYHLYDRPADRLKQAFLWGRKQLYRDFWALRNVSFHVQRGEVLGVIGRNGSGKSTLLQLICGVLQPTCGSVSVRGRTAALLELGSGFNPEFTGRENVYMNAAILGLDRKQIDQRFDQIIRFAEIGDFLDQPVKTYSSGMVVRLAFAITVHVDAEVLVVDEALSVGDVAFQFKCLSHLEDLLERGVTILLVSHDLQLVKSYCTRAIYLKGNTVEYQGDCEAATELYLKEMRAERERMLAESTVHARAAGGDGEILSARMGCEDHAESHFKSGQRVWLDVSARIPPTVSRPRLIINIRDLKGYGLFGFNNHHANVELTPDTDGRIGGRFWFTCALREGDYSIALRLEDCRSDTLRIVLDKRPNALQFKVLEGDRAFLGTVDLDGAFEQSRAVSARSKPTL